MWWCWEMRALDLEFAAQHFGTCAEIVDFYHASEHL
jgi:hypothetical protein